MKSHDEIVIALQSLRPGSQWVLRGDTCDNLEWPDQTQTKPTEAEINAFVPRASTPAERLAAVGLTLDDFKSLVKEIQ